MGGCPVRSTDVGVHNRADEKTPQELLVTLNNVLKDLSKEHDVDVRDEPVEQTAQRIFYYMPTLKYDYQGKLEQMQMQLQQGDPEQLQMQLLEQLQMQLQQGDRELIYSMLHHILSKLPDLRKRAYLSRFLTKLKVPEEMFGDHDQEVTNKFSEYEQLLETFEETHKNTDRLKGTSMQPTELKREVNQLDEEKQQLTTKITKLRTRLKKLANFDELHEVTSRLRKEQEKEANLADRFQEQTKHIQEAEAVYSSRQKLLRDVQQSASDSSSGEEILQRLEQDVRMTQERVDVKWPQDIATKQQRLEEVQKLLNLPEVSADDLRNEEDEISSLSQQEEALLKQKLQQQPKGNDKLSMERQQAALVGSKKSKAQFRYDQLKEDNQTLEEDLAEKRKKLGRADVPRILKGAEFQKYAEGLKIKAKEYKKKKGELSSVVAEKGILSRTEDILKGRHGDQSEFLANLEKQKGVSGAAAMQDRCVGVCVSLPLPLPACMFLYAHTHTHTHIHTYTHTHTHTYIKEYVL